MKRFSPLLLPLFVIVVFTSCAKEPEQNLPSIETDTLNVAYYGIADSILVSTELELNVSILPSGTTWLRTRINITSNNQKYVVIEADQNPTSESRTAQVKITATGFSHTITVIQEPFSGPHLSTDRMQVLLWGLSGSLDSFKVSSNLAWTVLISSPVPWLEIINHSGNDTGYVKLKTLSHHNTNEIRTVTLAVHSVLEQSINPILITVTQRPIGYFNHWSKIMGGSFMDQFNSITKTNDGGTVSAGWFGIQTSDTTWHSDAWIVKKVANGNTAWDKKYGGSGGEQVNAVISTSDGGYAVAGFTMSNDGSLQGLNPIGGDFWLMKLDPEGNRIWQKTFGGTALDIAYGLVQSADGGFVITGYTESNDGDVSGNHGGADVFVVKTDAAGNKQWTKTLGGNLEDKGTGITLTNDGGFIISAKTKSNNGDVSDFLGGPADGWLIKLNASGGKVWDRTVGGTYEDEAHSVFTTSTGDFIVTGYSLSYLGGERNNGDVMITKVSQTGARLWDRALGSWELDKGFSIIQSSQGHYVLAGFANAAGGDVTSNNGMIDGWIVAIDDNENIIWEKALGGAGRDYILGLTETSTNTFVVTGYEEHSQMMGNASMMIMDGWVQKILVR